MFEIRRGDLFDYSLLLHLPVAVQNQTIAFMMPRQHLFEHPLFRPTYGAARRPDYPGQSTLSTTSVTLVQHLALGYCGAAACRPAWQEAEPDNATPGYYYLAQRVFCGEGDSLLPELYAQWWAYPSTQLDDLLLRWCRQYRPDFFPAAGDGG